MKHFLEPLMLALSISLISSCGVKIVDINSSCDVSKKDGNSSDDNNNDESNDNFDYKYLSFDVLNGDGTSDLNKSITEQNTYVEKENDRVILTSEQSFHQFVGSLKKFDGKLEEISKKVNFDSYDLLLIGNMCGISTNEIVYTVNYVRMTKDSLRCFLSINRTSGDDATKRTDFMIKIPKVDSNIIQRCILSTTGYSNYSNEEIKYY